MIEKLGNFLKHPIKFILRQIYKLLIVLPFQFFVSLLLSKSMPGQEKTEICFLITSVISPLTQKNVSYDAPRSIYSAEERLDQTKQTIKSIRTKVPDAKIIFIEGGRVKDSGEIKNIVDQYIYIGNKILVRWSVDSKNKSLGEAVMLIASLKKWRWQAEWYLKISGRYFLTEEFDLSRFRKNKLIFGEWIKDYYITRLYSFGLDNFFAWKKALIFGLPLNLIDYAIEHTIARYLPKDKVEIVPRLGISGMAAGIKGKLMND